MSRVMTPGIGDVARRGDRGQRPVERGRADLGQGGRGAEQQGGGAGGWQAGDGTLHRVTSGWTGRGAQITPGAGEGQPGGRPARD